MNKRAYILGFTVGVFILAAPLLVFAQGFLEGLSAQCLETGRCDLNQVGLGFVLLSKWLLGLMGAMALFYFVWGGVWWLTSAGNQDKVKRGRDIMVGTSIALFIAFGSYLILDLWVNDILGAETGQLGQTCETRSAGSPCGGDNYHVCAGQDIQGEYAEYSGVCVTKCEYENIRQGIPRDQSAPDYMGQDYVCADICRVLFMCDADGERRDDWQQRLQDAGALIGKCPAVNDYCVQRRLTNF